MNVNDIKPAASGNIPPGLNKEQSARQANNPGNVGLQELAAEQVSLSQNSKIVSGARILQMSFEQTVSFSSFSFSSNRGGILGSINAPESQKAGESNKAEDKPIFDFEEVAKNVLSFVDGAMQMAKANGANDEELGNMLQKARDGVLKGVEMAKEELAGMMNDDIELGIENSIEAINKGLDDIEKNLFGPSEAEQVSQFGVGASQSLTYSREDVAELNFTTKDGDEVTISFEDIQRYSEQREAFIAAQSSLSGEGEEASIAAYAGQSYEFFESNRFSFSVKGELDEEELKDLSELVEKTAGVVDEFFNGDVEAAFKQASEVGLEDSQIVGFSMELSRTETVEVVQTYQQVSNYSGGGEGGEKPPQPPLKTIGDYLDNFLSALDQNNKLFGKSETFDDLVTGLISEVEQIKVPELIEALNRFQTFNQRLLDALPPGVAPEGSSAQAAPEPTPEQGSTQQS